MTKVKLNMFVIITNKNGIKSLIKRIKLSLEKKTNQKTSVVYKRPPLKQRDFTLKSKVKG